MSRITRRKHILKEMMEDDFELPNEQQQIVRVLNPRGNNLHEVEPADPQAENFLVSMPNKFRNNIWVKRGDFLLIIVIEEGHKVKGEICKVLTPEHIKEYTKAGIWPKRFIKNRESGDQVETEEQDDDDDDDYLVRNTNKPDYYAYDVSDEEEETSTAGSDDEDECEGEEEECKDADADAEDDCDGDKKNDDDSDSEDNNGAVKKTAAIIN